MGAGTWESHHAITALLYRYAECIDAADFDGIGALFADGKITNEGYRGAIVGRDAVHDLYAGTNRVHSDGTLRTRHLATNVFVVEDPGSFVPVRCNGKDGVHAILGTYEGMNREEAKKQLAGT